MSSNESETAVCGSFEHLDDWEVNHWLPSNRTSVPQLIETFSLFQLVGVNPVMQFCTYIYYIYIYIYIYMYRLVTEHRGVLTIHIPRAEPEGVYSQ